MDHKRKKMSEHIYLIARKGVGDQFEMDTEFENKTEVRLFEYC